MRISVLTSFACFAALTTGAMAHGDQSQMTTTAQSASTPAPTTAKITAPTPAPTTGKSAVVPAPTAATPAPTTGKTPATSAPTTTKTLATPASTTGKTSSTPAPTAVKQAATTAPIKVNCFNISVEGDATYCITGPICSGSGKAPAGVNCPKEGDVAVQSCLKTLKSYAEGGKCVAPVDAECKVIRTGAWGCVWKGAEPIGVPTGKAPATPAPATSKVASTLAPTTAKTASTPAPTTGKTASTPAPTFGKTVATPAPTTAKTAVTPAPTTGKSAVTPAPTTGKTSSTPVPSITKTAQTGSQPREAVQPPPTVTPRKARAPPASRTN